MKPMWHFVKSIHSFGGRILYFNLIGSILMSLFEGIGIFLLIPLLSLIGVFQFQVDQIQGLYWVQHVLTEMPRQTSLFVVLSIYVLLVTGQGYLKRNQTILTSKIHHGYLRHLRKETYKSLLESNWNFFLRKRKSDLIHLITGETARVSSGSGMILQFIASLVFTIVQLCLAFWLSAKMTLTILLFGLIILFLSKKLIKKSSHIAEETVELAKQYMAGITDHIQGIKEVKSNTLEGNHIQWVHSVGSKIENNAIESIRIHTFSQFMYKVLAALILAGFVVFYVQFVQAEPAQLLLIIAIFTRIWPRFSGIQANLEQLGTLVPSFKQLMSLQEDCIQSRELNEESYQNIKPLLVETGIECREVSFRYNMERPIYALQNISVNIPCNVMTAIVGPSGAGKSTLIDLLMGLNRPEGGQVLIDGQPISTYNLLPLRRSISYVPQDPFLFNGSIKDNLLMMQPNASVEEMWEALEFSSAAEFVRKLPQGLDTLIGDRGIRLSGGERQRLVLARAILRKPSILVLDEATSALDAENEAKIQHAIERLKGKMTIIVIAHRLSTIRNADKVIVLDGGQVVQTGEFSQLASEKRGLFHRLLNNQMEMSV